MSRCYLLFPFMSFVLGESIGKEVNTFIRFVDWRKMTSFVKIVPRQVLPSKLFLGISQRNNFRWKYVKVISLIARNNQSRKWTKFVHGQDGKSAKLMSSPLKNHYEGQQYFLL